jgi:hypothetical protein
VSHPHHAVLSAVEDNDEWQPHAAEEFQQVDRVGRLAIGLLAASTVTHLLSTWSDWNTYGVVNQYLGGGLNVDDADLNRADTIARITSIPNVIISVAAAVVFVIWLWRARVNSEVLCQADHRRSHGWVLASWFCPGPNLWYPKQIVDDVWLASDPKTPVYTDDLRRFRTPALTRVWWVTWVGALAFDVVIRRFLMWMDPTVVTLRGIALAGTASLVLTAISAVGATLVIRKINDMQTSRQWVPWWDQREPKLIAVPTYADDDTSEQPAIAAEVIQAPQLRLQRSPMELEPATAGAPYAPAAQGGSSFSAAPAGSPFGAAGAGFGTASASESGFGGSGFGGQGDSSFPAAASLSSQDEEAPKWSPFASVVETWQDDSGPATEQFSPIEAWQDEPGPVEEATPSYQQTAAGLDSPNWSTASSHNPPADDLLSAPLPSWQTESVAPPSLSLIQSDPYSYQSEPAESSQSWVASYSEPYVESYADSSSYDTSADYLTSSAPIPTPAPMSAPEPEPEPVARAGRRAARVAVDSPSTIQPAASYYEEPASIVSAAADDYLTPSKPLPTVPSYGPEPSYTPEPTYSPEPTYTQPTYTADPEPTYASYDTPVYEPSAYNPDYGTSYTQDAGSSYTADSGYSSEYSSSTEQSYDPYTPSSYDSTYSSSSYSSNYGTDSYDYSPNYTPESYSGEYQPTPDYSSTGYVEEPAAPQYQQPQYQQAQPQQSQYQQSPYSYEPAEPPMAQTDPQTDAETSSAPRTHPRRRWV